MIVFNQIVHLENLYKQLKYEEVIQFAPITLQLAMQEKRYNDAMQCYEYLASAYHEKGNFQAFVQVISEYEKLTLTYGNDANKMIYYYLMSLLKIIVRSYEDAIGYAEKSIRYAHLLNNEEMVVINFANIASQKIFLGKTKEAEMAERFASYYKDRLPEMTLSVVRGLIGFLYFYATNKEEDAFLSMKLEMIKLLNTKEAYTNYQAHIALAEGILYERLGNPYKSIFFIESAYKLFKEDNNFIFLNIIYRMLSYREDGNQMVFYDELVQIIESYQFPLPGLDRVESLQADLFIHEELHPMTFKYPNIVTKDQMEQHVKQAIANKQHVYCMHWSFMTEGIEELFGPVFERQFLMTLFDNVIEALSNFDAELLMRSKNEGEVIIMNISQETFFKLLIDLEQTLHSVFVHSTMGRVDIPIHFGFISTAELPAHQASYEELVAHADASLYYAKSQGKLYIYS